MSSARPTSQPVVSNFSSPRRSEAPDRNDYNIRVRCVILCHETNGRFLDGNHKELKEGIYFKESSSRKYGKAAGKHLKTEMHEIKRGKLKSGRSGKKVTSRKPGDRN